MYAIDSERANSNSGLSQPNKQLNILWQQFAGLVLGMI